MAGSRRRRLPMLRPRRRGGGGRGGRGGSGGGATRGRRGHGHSHRRGPARITFTVRMVIDRAAERQQVFEEAWRMMKNRFYDAKMHGVNWAAAKDTYESLLPNIADTEELHNVIMEMIGELNASHTGISGGGNAARRAAAQERIQTRYPGFDTGRPTPPATTKSPPSTAKGRPTTTTSSWPPATSSWR